MEHINIITNYSQFLNEVIQVNKIKIYQTFNKIEPNIFVCRLKIYDKTNNIILDIDSCGIGKQKARQNASKMCLYYEELTPYINLKLNKTKTKKLNLV